MTRKAENLLKKLENIKYVNWELAREIQAGGGGATGIKATMFVNAGKDLMKVNREIRNAVNSGKISVEEYRIITERV